MERCVVQSEKMRRAQAAEESLPEHDALAESCRSGETLHQDRAVSGTSAALTKDNAVPY